MLKRSYYLLLVACAGFALLAAGRIAGETGHGKPGFQPGHLKHGISLVCRGGTRTPPACLHCSNAVSQPLVIFITASSDRLQ